MKTMFTVIYPDEKTGMSARIVDIPKFHEARDLADRCNGKVYPQLPGGLRDPIYPKPEAIMDWGEFNFALCLAGKVEKLPPDPMFHYTVWRGDYNLGGYNWDSEYAGTDRVKALKAYKDAKSWMGMAEMCISVRGRKEKRCNEEQNSWDDDWTYQCLLSAFD